MYYLVDFCRLCLSLKGEFTNMWLDDIMEKVTACISELDFDSNLPLLICSRCLEKLEDFFEFRNQCLQSEFLINGYLDKLLNNAQCKNFINTSLQVNVVKDFGTAIKCKGYVRLRTRKEKCYINVQDCKKVLQNSNVVRNVIDKTDTDLPGSDQHVTCRLPEIKLEVKSEVDTICATKSMINPGEAIELDLDEDDVFVEEEDDYNPLEGECSYKLLTSANETSKVANGAAINGISVKHTVNLDVHDPENLLIDNGQVRALFDVQTDVSERVKLRKRNLQIKPSDRAKTNSSLPGKDLAKKSTGGIKKSAGKKSPKGGKLENNFNSEKSTHKIPQAKKSTTKPSISSKKSKIKISGANCELWKAACRNWTLQRMQTLGHKTTGARSSPRPVGSMDTIKPTENQALNNVHSSRLTNAEDMIQKDNLSANSNSSNVTIATTVEYHDSPGDNTETVNASQPDANGNSVRQESFRQNNVVKSPRIKSINELNELLKQKNQSFSEKLSTEYGIVIDDENYFGTISESNENLKWLSLGEINNESSDFVTPQILNTFSLNDDDVWNPIGGVTDEEMVETGSNIQTCDLKPDISSTEITIDPSYQHLKSLAPLDSKHIQIINTPTGVSDLESNIGAKIGPHLKHTSKAPKTMTKGTQDPIILNSLQTFNLPSEPINLEQQTVTDYDGAIAAHLIDTSNSIKEIPISAPVPRVVLKPISSLKSPRSKTQYKIKTTNNIILIDSDKISSNVTSADQKLYKTNFGNILQHYLKSSTGSKSNKTASYCTSPIKVVVPGKHSSTGKKHTFKLNYSDLFSPTGSTYSTVIKTKKSDSQKRNRIISKKINSLQSLPTVEGIRSNWSNIIKNDSASSSSTNSEAPKINIPFASVSNSTYAKLNIPLVSANNPTYTIAHQQNNSDLEVESSERRTIDLQNPLKIEKPHFKELYLDFESISKTDPNTRKDNEVILIEDSPPLSSACIIDQRLGRFTPDNENTATATDQNKSDLIVTAWDVEFDDRLSSTPDNSTTAPHGSKRRVSLDDSRSPKSRRASSEESDALVIDDSLCRSKTPDEVDAIVPNVQSPEVNNGNILHSELIPLNTKLDLTNGTKASLLEQNGVHTMPNAGYEHGMSKLPEISAGVLGNLENSKQTNVGTNNFHSSHKSVRHVSEERDNLESRNCNKPSRNLETFSERCESPLQSLCKSKESLLNEFEANHCDRNFPSSTMSQQSSHKERTTTASQHLLKAVLKNAMDSNLSSDSDDSFVDVEAISDCEDGVAHPLALVIPNLHGKEKRRLTEKLQRRARSQHLNFLYNTIEKDFLLGKGIVSVLKSANDYIKSLKLKSDELDSELFCLKTKHECLVQKIAQFKEV